MAQTTAEKARLHRKAMRSEIERIARILRGMSGRVTGADVPSAYGGGVAGTEVLKCAANVLERLSGVHMTKVRESMDDRYMADLPPIDPSEG